MQDKSFEGCGVFTLNHDLLIERALEGADIDSIDGFGAPDGDVAWWSAELLDRQAEHYLLKLHGSIDWQRYDGRIAKSLGSDPEHAHTGDRKRLELSDRLRLLIGTFNKVRDYFMSPCFDVMAAFRRQLKSIDHLITSGYSFGDKGINAVLIEHCIKNATVSAKKGEALIGGCSRAVSRAIFGCSRWIG